MKQQPTQFGQAVMQLAQARQQVAKLQEQNDKLTAAMKELESLVKDYMEFSKYATPLLKRGRLEWEAESEALAQRAQALLAAKEQ